VQNGKKSALSKSAAKSIEPETIDIDAIDKPKPTTVEADVISQVEKDVAAESTPEEEAAKRITDAAIEKYWVSKEQQRLAQRVHQQDLSVYEKVLREFDVSGQYGVSAHEDILRWLAP
jgi:DNA polymerase delta subunit 4